MSQKTLMLIPSHHAAGLSVVVAAFKAFSAKGAYQTALHQAFYVNGAPCPETDRFDALLNKTFPQRLLGVNEAQIQAAIKQQDLEPLLEDVVRQHKELKADLVLIKALIPTAKTLYADELNEKVIRSLDADVLLVADARVPSPEDLTTQVRYLSQRFACGRLQRVQGVVVNHVGGEYLSEAEVRAALQEFPLWGCIPCQSNSDDDSIVACAAESLDVSLLNKYMQTDYTPRLSPAAFSYQVVKSAIAANKRIVLPEGDEPRTLRAANICAERGLAQCVLLAAESAVEKTCREEGITLNDKIKIMDPDKFREHYVARLVELRQHKGMTEDQAREQLGDNVMLGTMMLERGEVDGLVSGAVHTTANTIRPPLQIIKTKAGSNIVSSVFFMCLPDQVLVYGDCAVNPNPSAEELAQIAIQSADSAKAFGIEPRVAMLSYSTIDSGVGPDVDLVVAATAKVRELRPDIAVDGPLQYDAATVASVARKKAPNSPVAGRANVFIFPDLNTGNNCYKAVQRSANVLAIGPMLQGMRKPVNDLSRGALVNDIVYTIVLTAVQAAQA